MNAGLPILLVEDNSDDVLLFRHALSRARRPHPLYVVHDGQAAIDYLSGAGEYKDRNLFPLPELIMLDLKMPRLGGFEVLKWIRGEGAARLIPVIILSSSALADDVNRAYELAANAYMVKPTTAEALERLIQTVSDFWYAGEKPLSPEQPASPKPS
ncbi:MAG TPA: response regulator [Candidatus Binatia bacterium]|nr:response regulator [Candidatus Binatia bacterium]